MAWSHDIACDIAALRVRLAATRFFLALVRHELLRLKANFDPNQPRVPRGQHEGGRWTRIGGGPFAGSEAAPGIDRQPVGSIGKPSARPVAKPRAEGLDGNVILAQAQGGPPRPARTVWTPQGTFPASPAEETVYEIARMNAGAAVRFVREFNPRWQPRETSLYENIRGATEAENAVTREVRVYLDGIVRPLPSALPPRSRPLGIGHNGGPPLTDPREPARSPIEVLAPNGRLIGYRVRGAEEGIQTLNRLEFENALASMISGREFRLPVNGYPGVYYDFPDRCVIGVRISGRNGLTFELIEAPSGSSIKRMTKFHFEGSHE